MSFGDTWAKAANQKIEPSRGAYKVRVVGGNAFTSKDGDDYCKLDLEILEHPAGATYTDGKGDVLPITPGLQFEHFMGFKHEVGARINREALLTYGLRDPESIRSIEDLDDRVAALKGTEADVSVVYKDGYMNVNVSGSRPAPANRQSDIPSDPSGFTQGMTDAREQQAEFSAAAQRFDDDIPF